MSRRTSSSTHATATLGRSAVVGARISPLPPVFPFRWVIAHGEDEFGLWQTFELGGVRQCLRWMPPPHGGTFLMGSPADESGRYDNEELHEVAVGGFWIADTAVTQAMWLAVLNENPSRFSDDVHKPVEQVSWDAIVGRFLPRANAMLPGLDLRLPLEKEWEYAARAAGQVRSAYWWGDDISPADANFGQSWQAGSTVRVDSFRPNPQGLRILGNVLEWTADGWAKHPGRKPVGGHGPSSAVSVASRVLRGGCWDFLPRSLRLAFRCAAPPTYQSAAAGFRLARGAY